MLQTGGNLSCSLTTSAQLPCEGCCQANFMLRCCREPAHLDVCVGLDDGLLNANPLPIQHLGLGAQVAQGLLCALQGRLQPCMHLLQARCAASDFSLWASDSPAGLDMLQRALGHAALNIVYYASGGCLACQQQMTKS